MMQINNPSTYSQTNPRTFVPLSAVQSLKNGKNLFEVLRINPYTIVFDRKRAIRNFSKKIFGRKLFEGINFDVRHHTLAREFNSVRDKILQKLLKQGRISIQSRK